MTAPRILIVTTAGVTLPHESPGTILSATNRVPSTVPSLYYRTSGRDETFSVKGAPNKKGDEKKLEKALIQFRKSIRFVYLRSGESLSNFLSGTFKELLHTVLQEHLKSHVERANHRRQQYMSELSSELLTPLGDHAQQQLAEVMEEIQNVTVEPFVPELEETLSRADIIVQDSAKTTLINKGTGVRGALLVALLGYLARHSRRSLILAVEEPESFLHPRAQQELRSDLSSLAKRDDVTLLVTTHSPFLLDRNPSTLITALSKDRLDGRTEIGEQITGDSPHAPIISSLFGETITPTLLDSVRHLSNETKAVLFVEGITDGFYLESAASVAGREDLLHGLEIRPDEGAHKAETGLEVTDRRQPSLRIDVQTPPGWGPGEQESSRAYPHARCVPCESC